MTNLRSVRALTLTAAALVAAAGAAAPAAHADEPEAGPVVTEPDTEAETVTWVDGWAAGKKAAAESGKLMLVYVHRTSPP